MKRACLLIITLALLALPVNAAGSRADFDSHVGNAIAKLNREGAHADGMMRMAGIIQSEYGTPTEELKWAVEQQIPWGEIVALAYIRATNGRAFAQLQGANAVRDLWTYMEKAGMNSEKMARSMDQFLKRVERERNSQIFEQIRANRRVPRTPDLGSGFGLFQEAFDFRKMDEGPQPTKVHSIDGLAKGEQ
jgi:hypothetical protein